MSAWSPPLWTHILCLMGKRSSVTAGHEHPHRAAGVMGVTPRKPPFLGWNPGSDGSNLQAKPWYFRITLIWNKRKRPNRPDDFSRSWWLSLATEDSALSIGNKVTFKAINYAKRLESKDGKEARRATSPLTFRHAYLCMNICSAWGYFQPGVVQTQGQAEQAELHQHRRSKVHWLF